MFYPCGTSDNNQHTKARNDGHHHHECFLRSQSSERYILPPKQQLHTAPNDKHASKVPRNNLSPLWRRHVISRTRTSTSRVPHYVEHLECAPGPLESSTYQHMRRAQPSNYPLRRSHLVIFCLLRRSCATELLRTIDSSVVLTPYTPACARKLARLVGSDDRTTGLGWGGLQELVKANLQWLDLRHRKTMMRCAHESEM
jgi:hypothetical protein